MRTIARGFRARLVATACATVLLCAVPAASAQTGPAPGPGGGEGAVPGEAGADESGAGGADEAEALVRRIQASLAEVDAALEDASRARVAGDGIDLARRKHLEAIRDIEALIKQIKYQQSSNSKGQSGGKGGKGGGDSSSGGEPSGSKPAPRPSDGTQAPRPSGSQDGSKPTEGEEGGEQGGRKPTSPQPTDGSVGGNEQGNRVPPDETGTFTRTDTDARWGLLPPKMQERLMNLHVDDVPERYRAWLEAYIKALNTREQEGRTR